MKSSVETGSRGRVFLVVVFLFLYGAGIHRVLYWMLGPLDPHFYSRWGAITLSLLGGVSVAAIFLALVRGAAESGIPRLGRFIVRCGGWGVVSSVITFELFYILLAAVLANAAAAGGIVAYVNTFVLSCIDIQSYGLVQMLRILPFALAYGGVAGVTIWLARSHILSLPPRRDVGKRIGVWALGLGVWGMILVWVPGPGLLLQLAAIVFGWQALARISKGEVGRWRGWTGILLGSTGLLGSIIAVVVGMMIMSHARR